MVDETGHFVWPSPGAGSSKEVFEFAQGGVEAVGDLGLEEAAEAFDRIEFRAIGRQRQQPQVRRKPGVVARQMETGLVRDDDVQDGGIGAGDLLEKERVDIAIDGRGEQQLRGMRAVHLQRLMQVPPLVFGRVRRV